MAAKTTEYVVQKCGPNCSLNAKNLPVGVYDAIHRWYEQGLNNETIAGNVSAMGWPEVSVRALYRHKANHLVRKAELTQFGNDPVVLDPNAPAGPMTDLQILDKIIQAGAKQLSSQSVRISPDMTMKALELRLKLTQGSVFDDFLAAVGKAFSDEAPATPPETPAAMKSEDEAAQGGDDGPD